MKGYRVFIGITFLVITLAAFLLFISVAQAAPGPPKSYFLPWYEPTSDADLFSDQLRISNVDSDAATVEVYVAGVLEESAVMEPDSGWTPTLKSVANGGLVKVVSTNGQQLLVSQRIVFNGKVRQADAVPETDLDTSYYFTWYENIGMTEIITIGNTADESAIVDVYIDGSLKGTYPVSAAGEVEVYFDHEMGGPVTISSRNGQQLVVSKWTVYNGILNQVVAYPAKNLTSDYLWARYDSTAGRSDWVTVTNMNDFKVYVTIKIGPAVYCQTEIWPFNRVSPTFPETAQGPVEVTAFADGVNGSVPAKVLTDQRVLSGGSFFEIFGQSSDRLGSESNLSWYDDLSSGAQDAIYVGNPSQAAVSAYMNVGDSTVWRSNVIYPGTVAKVVTNGVRGGPLRIYATGPVVVNEELASSCSQGRPSLTFTNGPVYWASYADYVARDLTVGYEIVNGGSSVAYSTRITGSSSSDGVTLAYGLPVIDQDVSVGSSIKGSLKYQVPEGVGTFAKVVTSTAEDGCGTVYSYP